MTDDALLASVLKKLAASPGDWFEVRRDRDRDPLVVVDGGATITTEECAALKRMLEPPPTPHTKEENIAFRKAWDARVEAGGG